MKIELNNFTFYYNEILEQLEVQKNGRSSSFFVFESAVKELFDHCVELQNKLKQYEDYPIKYDVMENK